MMQELFFIGRFPKDISECYALGVKEDDYLFLTAGSKWSRDPRKGICFVTVEAAQTFLRRMRWKDRERSDVIPVSGSFA